MQNTQTEPPSRTQPTTTQHQHTRPSARHKKNNPTMCSLPLCELHHPIHNACLPLLAFAEQQTKHTTRTPTNKTHPKPTTHQPPHTHTRASNAGILTTMPPTPPPQPPAVRGACARDAAQQANVRCSKGMTWRPQMRTPSLSEGAPHTSPQKYERDTSLTPAPP